MIVYISYIVVLSYITLAVELMFFPVKSQGSTYRILKEKKISSLKSIYVLLPNVFAIGVILYPLVNLYFKWSPLAHYEWLVFVGIILVSLGRGLSFGAMLQLRRNREILHKDGFFKWTRNPNIDGTITFLLGIWFIMPHVLYLISIVLVFFYLKSRAKMEEIYLLELFGEKYLAYKNITPSSLYIWHQKLNWK